MTDPQEKQPLVDSLILEISQINGFNENQFQIPKITEPQFNVILPNIFS